LSSAEGTDAPAEADASTDEPEQEAPPRDERREALLESVQAELGDAVVGSHIRPGDDLWVRVTNESWVAAGEAVKHKLGCTYFDFLSVIDWLPSPYGKGEDDPSAPPEDPSPDKGAIKQGYTGGDTRFQMLARLTDLRRHVSVTLKADVPDTLSMPTWVHVFAGANWHEREAHEMFGIGFDGHPDLRHIYLPGEFEGYPMRKDFPLLSRMVKPWPGIVDVEPMPGVEDEADDAAEASA